ncbi:hypothetical protein DSO57_1036246 [Entomophthora muscae]|uniref:Uncharacterized protein n=1 Tax=Entomophthora muscae TaxID=34485 RepID=A0ACC2RQ97_9FUNG|nr:hypothetical protein DSO57_1036246 [Entomophthora muscae]
MSAFIFPLLLTALASSEAPKTFDVELRFETYYKIFKGRVSKTHVDFKIDGQTRKCITKEDGNRCQNGFKAHVRGRPKLNYLVDIDWNGEHYKCNTAFKGNVGSSVKVYRCTEPVPSVPHVATIPPGADLTLSDKYMPEG